MKGFTDELNYIVELLEGGTTLEDVIDNHIYDQALVSLPIYSLCCIISKVSPTPLLNMLVYTSAIQATSYTLFSLVQIEAMERAHTFM